MCFADYSHHHRTLLDCFLCIFYLKYSTLGGAEKVISAYILQTGGASTYKVTESLS